MNNHLTEMFERDVEVQAAKTHPGQAYFAGTGPGWRTCQECTHFAGRDHFTANKASAPGGLKLGPCRKYTELAGRRVPDIPHDAWACKYFEPNPAPPPAKRLG